MPKTLTSASGDSTIRLAEALRDVVAEAVEPLRADVAELKGGLSAMEGRFSEHRKEMSKEAKKYHEEIKKMLTGGVGRGPSSRSARNVTPLAAKGRDDD